MRAETDALRIGWIDSLRGYGLVFVVLGHVLIGLMHAHHFEHTETGSFLIIFFYLFHMPLIFFVSGYVSRDARKKVTTFLATLLKWIVAPYVIWCVLTVGLQAIVPSDDVNRKFGFDALPQLWYHPILLYWFFYALFWVKLIDYSVSLITPLKYLTPALAGTALAGLGIMIEQMPLTDDVPFKFGCGLLFYALGRLAGTSSPKVERVLSALVSRPVLYGLAVGSSFGILLVFARFYLIKLGSEGVEPFIFQPLLPLTGIAGTVLFALVSYLQAKRGVFFPVRTIGIYAICVYVQHVLWAAALRVLLIKLGLTNDLALTLLLWVAAITCAVLWQKIADYLGVSWLFGIRPVAPSFWRRREASVLG